MEKFILASSSPRRIEILNNLKLEFDVIPSNYDEKMENNFPAEETACFLARNKAIDVYNSLESKKLVVAADTIVYCEGMILGKPKNHDDAYKMLKLLSGKKHKVITGMCIINKSLDSIYEKAEETIVEFKKLGEDEIINYINTNEPFDKAGAYGIQGLGGLFVKRIEGCYFNVMGFPVHRFYIMMRDIGVNLLLKDV